MRIFQASYVVMVGVFAATLSACPKQEKSSQAVPLIERGAVATPTAVDESQPRAGRGAVPPPAPPPAALERGGGNIVGGAATPRLTPTPAAPSPSAVDAGVAGRTLDAGVGGALDLERFTGFSKDGSKFAFSVYSDGAGFYLLHVVDGPSGELKQRFILDAPESKEKARAFLTKNGFTEASGKLPPGMTVDARLEKGQVVVTRKGGGKPEKTLHRGNPFKSAGGGKPQRVTVGPVSPKGDKVAIRAEQVPVTEFGGIVTYMIIDVQG